MNLKFIIANTLSIVLLISNLNAQIDSRLTDVFTLNELQKLEKNNPDSLNFMHFILKEGYYFMDYPTGKSIDCENLPDFTKDELKQFNFFKYNLKILNNKQNYYKLGDTGKVLVILSYPKMKMYYEQEKKRKNEK